MARELQVPGFVRNKRGMTWGCVHAHERHDHCAHPFRVELDDAGQTLEKLRNGGLRGKAVKRLYCGCSSSRVK